MGVTSLPPPLPAGYSAAPADVIRRDLPQPMPELGHLQVDDLAAKALGSAVLAHNPAGQTLGDPVALLQDHDGPAAALQAQTFRSARSHCFAEALRARASPSPAPLPATSFISFGEAFG